MRTCVRALTVVVLVGLGYALGSLHLLDSQPARAQVAQPQADSLNERIKKSYRDLKAIQDDLVRDGRYQPAVNGVNSFAVTVGGVNAMKDLEEGRGVDPETFAGLYAGQATDRVAVNLTTKNNRLYYKGQVVRMYSVSRLKKLWKRRAEIAEVTQTLPGVGGPTSP